MGPEGITITYGNDGDSCSSDSDCTEYGFSCDTSQRKCVTSCNDREDNDGDAGIDSFGACYAGGGYFSCSQIGVDSTDYGSLTAYREACEKECEPQINVFGSTVSATYVEYDFNCGFDPYGAGSESGCSSDEDCPLYTTCDMGGTGTCSSGGSENAHSDGCRDGLDNEHDGDTDCDDSECASVCCTSDSDCASDAACLITDLDPSATGEDIVGNCITCVDSDDGIHTKVKGEIKEAVWLDRGDYSTDMVDTCVGGKIREYVCQDISGHLYATYKEYSCADFDAGYGCKGGVCVKGSSALLKSTTSTKLKSPEYEEGSSLPWILGGVGVLLIGGAAYWFFTKKNGGKKTKK